ncbi:MAG: DNA mismatch repair endonuclease MutL, partial [Kiritimatiellae bacterium]|nr:DNA mismatch repair endonuclease MutL [Kiritimatiellia bacterium]
MSPRIHSLPDAVIDQIAAGEVIERPASVVKELMENAFDAGATRVEVDAEDGGRKLLRIRDDGCGMDKADALKSIERHATSKLSAISDLDTLRTMGFRGEALSSISAVSQFTLSTAEEGASEGTEVTVFGGRIQRVDAVPPVRGTCIHVRNLFFNIPARRKFLRTAATEFVHVRSAFILEAIANPAAECILRADGEDVYRLAPSDRLLPRVRDIFGSEVAGHLRELSWENGVVSVTGLAGLPPFSRADRAWQIVLVNGRPASSPVIQYAIQTAYRGMLPAGRHAPLFLSISLPGTLVDVNVHPAKKEVRFRRPNEVRDGLVEALRLAVQGAPDRSRAFRAPQTPFSRATWEERAHS